MLNVDTHILVHLVGGTLSAAEASLLKQERIGIASIVLWELATLHRLGRIAVRLDDKIMQLILERIHVWEISPAVCAALAALDFRSDPADELIAATSVAHRVPLVTRDQKILRSKIVPLVRA